MKTLKYYFDHIQIVEGCWRTHCKWEYDINVWFRFMHSQKWNCAASLFPKQNYNVLSPNFHIHESVSDLYISTIGLPRTDRGNIQIAHRYMNLKMGTRQRSFISGNICHCFNIFKFAENSERKTRRYFDKICSRYELILYEKLSTIRYSLHFITFTFAERPSIGLTLCSDNSINNKENDK